MNSIAYIFLFFLKLLTKHIQNTNIKLKSGKYHVIHSYTRETDLKTYLFDYGNRKKSDSANLMILKYIPSKLQTYLLHVLIFNQEKDFDFLHVL